MLSSSFLLCRDERKKRKHAEYWAGRLKGTREIMETDLKKGVRNWNGHRGLCSSVIVGTRTRCAVYAMRSQSRFHRDTPNLSTFPLCFNTSCRVNCRERSLATEYDDRYNNSIPSICSPCHSNAPPSFQVPIDEFAGDPMRLEFYPMPDSYEDLPRWRMMQALHRCGDTLDPEISAVYIRAGNGFYGIDSPWANITLGELRSSLVVAALLR